MDISAIQPVQLPNRFLKMYKTFTEKAKWHFSTKPRHESTMFDFRVNFTVSDPTTMNQPTYHAWLDSPEAQAAAPGFPKVCYHNPTTRQTMTVDEYEQNATVVSETASTTTEAPF